MDLEKINRVYKWVSIMTGALAFCLGILWFAHVRSRTSGDFWVVLLLCILFWRATYYLIGFFLLSFLGKPAGLVEKNPLRKPMSLREMWPEISDLLTAKKHVKRGAIGLGFICLFLLIGPSGIASQRNHLFYSIRVAEIILCLMFLWGMTRYYLWASIGALVYWIAKSLFVVWPEFNYFSFLVPITCLTLLIHGTRGIIVYRRISRTPESKSELFSGGV